MASDQSDAAAERSAHVLRDEPRPGGVLAPMVEVEPGVWRLRIIVELEARLAAAEAERDAARMALRMISHIGLGPDRGSAQHQIDVATAIASDALRALPPLPEMEDKP